MDVNKVTVMIFLGLKEAFDTVDHNIALQIDVDTVFHAPTMRYFKDQSSDFK